MNFAFCITSILDDLNVDRAILTHKENESNHS